LVDLRKSVVDNQPWAPVPLGDNAQGRQAEAGEVFDRFKRQDDPEEFLDKVGHFIFDKVKVF
jgi:hypothetical protein